MKQKRKAQFQANSNLSDEMTRKRPFSRNVLDLLNKGKQLQSLLFLFSLLRKICDIASIQLKTVNKRCRVRYSLSVPIRTCLLQLELTLSRENSPLGEVSLYSQFPVLQIGIQLRVFSAISKQGILPYLAKLFGLKAGIQY